jgi:hypothetical protein
MDFVTRATARGGVSGPLVPGGAAGDAIVIDDTQVSVESGCPAVTGRAAGW